MKYNGIIETKLRLIEQKLTEIRSWEIGNFKEFQKSSLLQNTSENIDQLQKIKILRPLKEYNDMVRF